MPTALWLAGLPMTLTCACAVGVWKRGVMDGDGRCASEDLDLTTRSKVVRVCMIAHSLRDTSTSLCLASRIKFAAQRSAGNAEHACKWRSKLHDEVIDSLWNASLKTDKRLPATFVTCKRNNQETGLIRVYFTACAIGESSG
ncbi:hypothetical protein GQ44DRAFT_150356 [Phaeosphaeriaceae sp. PMI808]|nr:hypothetical protein GQ44DRAFT_150356 [Phaeosphaeriaceae sp. PMI808]